MNLKWVVSPFLLFLLFLNNASAQNIGFKQVIITTEPNRPLSVAIWYPTHQVGPLVTAGENPAFIGTQVIKNATIDVKSAPVVLLSHGYRGNWRNLNWLASALAHRGYIVAAPDHPGTTTFDHAPAKAAKWWLRVLDISHVLDYLLSNEQWKNVINRSDISAVGHSLGGWTVMQLAGAVFDRQTFKQQCSLYPGPRTCGLANELGLEEAQENEPASGTLYDSRIKRVVSLDLGMARSFLPSSLNAIHHPVLVLAAGIDIGDLPQALESGYLAEHLPLSLRRYKVYEQATHFSFIQLCKQGAVSLLEEEVPGDGVICKDGKGSKRSDLHQQIFSDVLTFLLSPD
ncbi:alpha/beta hydrolase family protein [Vibrio sp. Hal054]|uniref:alpha/beta hydrolase family protein n=1 Tax=Vibrio sp. Hal054 TaxID=3035158 RepID=UPI00301B9AEC